MHDIKHALLKGGQKTSMIKTRIYFGEGCILASMLGSDPMFKNIGDGPIKWLLLRQEKKEDVGTHLH